MAARSVNFALPSSPLAGTHPAAIIPSISIEGGGAVRGKRYNRPTLGSAARAHLLLRTWCNRCRNIVDIDPGEQVEGYGADLSVSDWVTRLVCPQCGSGVIVSVVAPSPPGWIR